MIASVTLPGGSVIANEFVEPLEHFVMPLQAVASIDHPVVFIGEDHQSTRYPKSISRTWCQHKYRRVELKRHVLLQCVPHRDAVALGQAVIFAPMDR